MKLVRQILRSSHVSHLVSLLAFVAFGPSEPDPQALRKER